MFGRNTKNRSRLKSRSVMDNMHIDKKISDSYGHCTVLNQNNGYNFYHDATVAMRDFKKHGTKRRFSPMQKLIISFVFVVLLAFLGLVGTVVSEIIAYENSDIEGGSSSMDDDGIAGVTPEKVARGVRRKVNTIAKEHVGPRAKEVARAAGESASKVASQLLVHEEHLKIHAKQMLLPTGSIYKLKEVEGPIEIYKGAKEKMNFHLYVGIITLVVNIPIIINSADENSQYAKLMKLQDKYLEQGVAILAFPVQDEFVNNSNGRAEYDNTSDEMIQKNLPKETNFKVFGKSRINSNPVYEAIYDSTEGKFPKNHYYKFLVNRKGIPIRIYKDNSDPLTQISDDIQHLIDEEPFTRVDEFFNTDDDGAMLLFENFHVKENADQIS